MTRFNRFYGRGMGVGRAGVSDQLSEPRLYRDAPHHHQQQHTHR